jgi:hypothetical protein
VSARDVRMPSPMSRTAGRPAGRPFVVPRGPRENGCMPQSSLIRIDFRAAERAKEITLHGSVNKQSEGAELANQCRSFLPSSGPHYLPSSLRSFLPSSGPHDLPSSGPPDIPTSRHPNIPSPDPPVLPSLPTSRPPILPASRPLDLRLSVLPSSHPPNLSTSPPPDRPASGPPRSPASPLRSREERTGPAVTSRLVRRAGTMPRVHVPYEGRGSSSRWDRRDQIPL